MSYKIEINDHDEIVKIPSKDLDISLLYLQCTNIKSNLERMKKEYLEKLCIQKFNEFTKSCRYNIHSETCEEYIQIFLKKNIDIIDVEYDQAIDNDIYSGNILIIHFGDDEGKIYTLTFITGLCPQYNCLTIEDEEYYFIENETIDESNMLFDILYSIHEKMIDL